MDSSKHGSRVWILFAVLLIALQGAVLFFLGQPAICECGYVKLWEGMVHSIGNSQHITDWYTFSHVIHGILFYLVLWLAFPRMPVMYRFLIALGIEVSWEILENTPFVINQYREQALAAGYTGDSILNSLSDSCAMMLGFLAARKLPITGTFFLVIFLEIGVAFFIRDNLTLNILNFVHQFPAIHDWQAEMW